MVSFNFLGLAGHADVQARALLLVAAPTLSRPRHAGRLRRRHLKVRRGIMRPARLLRHDRCVCARQPTPAALTHLVQTCTWSSRRLYAPTWARRTL